MSDADRLHDVVSLAARSGSRVRRVLLHLRSERTDAFELCATSDENHRARADGSLRAGGTLITRVLDSELPVVVTEPGAPRGVRVMARVLGWDGDAAGILTFELADEAGHGPEALGPQELQELGSLASLVAQTIGALDRTQELSRANASLMARAGVDRRLVEVSQNGGGLSAIVREAAALTGKAVTLFDHVERPLSSAHQGAATVRCPALAEILGGRGPVPADSTEPFIVPAGRSGGLSRRKVVAPVVAGGETFGWLVIDEHPSGFRPLDKYVAHRASVHLASELLVQRRVARMAWNAKSALVRSMVRGTHTAKDLMASAEYLGVDTNARRVLAYVLEPSRARPDGASDELLATAVEQQLGVEVLATRGSEGVLLLVEAPADRGTVSMVHEVKAALESATEQICGPDVIVGVSTVCEPTALSRGYREAREVVHCIDRFAGRSGHRVLAVDDLGPARLFLANSDTSAIRGYVHDVLGPLLTGDPGTTDLLVTLQCYFDASRSVRTSAARLGVHENTIRLRLARVATATGLDVAGDANDQLSVQTALLVLRLQGHPVLPDFAAFEAGEDRAERPVAEAAFASQLDADHNQRKSA